MSAIATVLGLLLVVTFVTQFVLTPLPGVMSDLELRHVLLVENQVGRLQSTIQAEAENPNLHLTLASPVTLGSQASPPFGIGATSTLSLTGGSARAQSKYAVGEIVPVNPNWNTGSACLSGGAGTCSTASKVDWWNESGVNASTFTVTISGGSNALNYNLTGNNDTINVVWTGGNAKFLRLVVNGSNNTVTYNKNGADSTTAPTTAFWFYGQGNTFNFNPSGSSSSASGSKLSVLFSGEYGQTCPAGNLSGTDTIGTLSSGGTNLNMTVTWWNLVGWTTPNHKQTYPGGGGKNESITWSNKSGFVQCGFTKTYATSYTTQELGGIQVAIDNIYIPRAVVAYDNGAVVEGQAGGASTMVDPPPINFVQALLGVAVSLTLVGLIGNYSSESGVTTAAIATALLSAHTVTIGGFNATTALTSPYFLNLTTLYPGAWSMFFGAMHAMVPSGTTCVPIVPIPSPYTCLAPPPATFERIVVPIVAQEITITVLTLAVTID
ncbi:MAG: hypothetical protein L3K15_02375 [Thermoplasmata archaeon]|nr:hypothetical protein [Thermoplasmata archaeon]